MLILLLVGTAFCLWIYIGVFFAARRKDFLGCDDNVYETFTMLPNPLHKPERRDILWCAVCGVVVAASQYGILSMYVGRKSDDLWSVNIFVKYVLPQMLSAMLVFTFSKLFTGNVFASVLGAFMLAFILPAGNEYLVMNRLSCVFLITAGICLYMWFACSYTTIWSALVLSAIFLGMGTYLFPPVIIFSIFWLVVVLFGEAIRINMGSSPAELLLVLLVGVGSLCLSVTLAQLPEYLHRVGTFRVLDLLSPQLYNMLWQRLREIWQEQRYDWMVTADIFSFVLGVLFTILCFHHAFFQEREDYHPGVPLAMIILCSLVMPMFCPVDVIVPLSGIALAYLTNYALRRRNPGLAYVAGPLPVLLTLVPVFLAFA